jgi:hypothetical protein
MVLQIRHIFGCGHQKKIFVLMFFLRENLRSPYFIVKIAVKFAAIVFPKQKLKSLKI